MCVYNYIIQIIIYTLLNTQKQGRISFFRAYLICDTCHFWHILQIWTHLPLLSSIILPNGLLYQESIHLFEDISTLNNAEFIFYPQIIYGVSVPCQHHIDRGYRSSLTRGPKEVPCGWSSSDGNPQLLQVYQLEGVQYTNLTWALTLTTRGQQPDVCYISTSVTYLSHFSTNLVPGFRCRRYTNTLVFDRL